MQTRSHEIGAPRRRRVFWTLVALGVVALAVLSVFSVFDGVFWPITRSGRYGDVTDKYRRIGADRPAGADLLAVFPTEVPSAARNVRFNCWTPPGDESL